MNIYWYTAECTKCKTEYKAHKLQYNLRLCRNCRIKKREEENEKESIC